MRTGAVWLSARDTVAVDTPAASATSRIVVDRLPSTPETDFCRPSSCARALGRYPSLLIAERTARVALNEQCGLLFSTRDTVDTDRPASAATCAMVVGVCSVKMLASIG